MLQLRNWNPVGAANSCGPVMAPVPKADADNATIITTRRRATIIKTRGFPKGRRLLPRRAGEANGFFSSHRGYRKNSTEVGIRTRSSCDERGILFLGLFLHRRINFNCLGLVIVRF